MKSLSPQDLQGLDANAMAELAAVMLQRLAKQEPLIAAKDAQLAAKEAAIAAHEREHKFKDARLERLTFQVAQYKAWKSAPITS